MMGKSYDEMSPAEKREADRMTRMGGENEARGSEDERGHEPYFARPACMRAPTRLNSCTCA